MNERTHFFIKNISLTLYSQKGWCWFCVRDEMETGGRLLYRPKFFFDHSSTSSSCWMGCSTVSHWGPQALSLHADSHAGILSPTNSNWLEPPWAPGYINVLHPPASAVLPLFNTGAPLDWRFSRRSICYTSSCDRHDEKFHILVKKIQAEA